VLATRIRCLLIQETNNDTKFPTKELTISVTRVPLRQGQWNGVAILSKLGMRTSRADSVTTIRGAHHRRDVRQRARVSCYVPNGRALDTALRVQIQWLEKLRDLVAARDANQSIVVVAIST